jgi:hypothetical protein
MACKNFHAKEKAGPDGEKSIPQARENRMDF